ncbi:SDR family oxidoreductase [Alcanivorax sp. DG881]|jgi:NAD(P)-dependent dehydrogenase (short-subunit alcohol dehydrogenase family)/pimeloyl-ACP methyl ester carboxylesterase|uniref:SDR family oxidoreductase n=1 Tax=Alcanivorax sp. DG881 TaxID=236097 RepID=UPI00017EC8A6|nr:SDR family oxidoreductase [Alcanivorax sp. DG881]EDX89398.1 oxidoreductase, short chain dehydrogenase/reductase family [Alcanivorax sp. DG881]
MVQWRDSKVSRDGVDLAVRTWSSDKSPTVVLVHGYPDANHVWEKVAERLSRDFKVVAYDVRGAGNSSIPKGRAAYKLRQLRDDLHAVMDAVCPNEKVHLVGHDWGSIQTWESVTDPGAEQRIASYTTLSGPCLDHVGQWMKARLREQKIGTVLNQLAHSWYIGAFQLPVLAPTLWKVGLAKAWPQLLRRSENLHSETSATQQQDGIHGIELYRANMRPSLLKPRERYTKVPVQLIVAREDNYVRPAMLEDLHLWTDRLWRRELDCGHWGPLLQHPDVTARWIREFIQHIDGAPASGPLQRSEVTGTHPKGPDSGKRVVVTGAGSGIGRETALAFARRGALVLCTDINAEAAASTASIIIREGGDALSRKCDVSNTRSMEALANYVEKELGAPDILINNAGIGLSGSLLDTSVKDWQQVLGVNLWGVIHGCRLFARQMVDNGKAGHIVNVASAAAFLPSRMLPAYATSKSAVLMFSECLRAEMAEHNIGVSAICPGIIDTPITRSTRFVGVADEEQSRRREDAAKLYQRRAYTPDRVAQAIVEAVQNNRAVVPVSPEARGMQWLGRFTPSLARNLAQVDMTP